MIVLQRLLLPLVQAFFELSSSSNSVLTVVSLSLQGRRSARAQRSLAASAMRRKDYVAAVRKLISVSIFPFAAFVVCQQLFVNRKPPIAVLNNRIWSCNQLVWVRGS